MAEMPDLNHAKPWQPQPSRPIERGDLVHRFTYHAPHSDQPARYEAIRQEALNLAQTITSLTPASREQSLAITNLEQAVYWANAAIARNEG